MPKTTPWDDLKRELLSDPEVRAEVERLEPEYQAARARYQGSLPRCLSCGARMVPIAWAGTAPAYGGDGHLRRTLECPRCGRMAEDTQPLSWHDDDMDGWHEWHQNRMVGG